MVRLVLKRRPSAKNPNYCGSTTLAEQMRPTEFSRLMNRFFDCANRVVIDSDGLVDKLVGDEVVALYVPAVGPDHARKAVEAAGDLLRATADLVPVGAGVHTCVAYVARRLRLDPRRLHRARRRGQRHGEAGVARERG